MRRVHGGFAVSRSRCEESEAKAALLQSRCGAAAPAGSEEDIQLPLSGRCYQRMPKYPVNERFRPVIFLAGIEKVFYFFLQLRFSFI
jgi:hypothetical protein